MSSFALYTLALTMLLGVLYFLIRSQQIKLLKQLHECRQALNSVSEAIEIMSRQSGDTSKRVKQLATDVLHREIYQSAEERHKLAIQSAKQGKSVFELVQKHGLSTDEAALIISLHAPGVGEGKSGIKNANLLGPAKVDLI